MFIKSRKLPINRVKQKEIAILHERFGKDVQMDIAVKSVELQNVIDGLRQAFSQEIVDIDLVTGILNSYESDPLDWKDYAKFDKFRYTRNLIDEGNGKYNLMLLCWGEGHGSAIHDHADAHCFMKVLHGKLCEVRFAWPDETYEEPEETAGADTMMEIGRTILNKDNVCYINDYLGLHRVENPSSSERAVSLHVYCPPFDRCHVFNQRSGEKSVAKVTFWSKYGNMTERKVKVPRPPEDN